MKKHFKFSLRLRRVFELLCVTIVYFSLWRAVFYLAFYKKAENFFPGEVLRAFLIGLRFDLRVGTILLLPILILSLSRVLYWSTSNKQKIWSGIYAIIYFSITFFFAGDLGHYAYLESRVSSSMLLFLKNPMISLEMVWESYHVIPWLLALALLSYTFYQYFRRRIFIYDPADIKNPRLVQATQGVTLSLVVLLGIWGSIGQYPLRWSEAFFTQNIFVASLAMNPVHYFMDTLGRSQKAYDLEKTKNYYPVVSEYLNVKDKNLETLNFKRPLELTPKFDHLNVVYIVMESMAAYKTGVFGNPVGASPSLDQLAKSGWLFHNYYVPVESTARSLFCVLTGIPDIDAKSSSSRNPMIVNQHTLINGFKDYDKFYFIGGSASWGNIRGVYMNNVAGLKMYEQDQLGGPRTDVWGLSDLDLFRQTARVLKERDASKPFFAIIQSASFHRPYTIPEEAGDFKKLTLSEDELHKYGFKNNDEYNSFRFADYSLGEFFRLIKDSKFYENTLFIIHGDHGLPHDGAAHLAEGYKHFGINRFHTPLVFFSPKMQKHEDFNMMITEPDVMPTVLGILGAPYINNNMGRNVFAIDSKQHRYAFSYVYYSEPLQVMLYDQEFLAFGTEKKVESLHKYMTPDWATDVKDQYPEKFKEMEGLLMGYFETSKYILHNNPRIKEVSAQAHNQ